MSPRSTLHSPTRLNVSQEQLSPAVDLYGRHQIVQVEACLPPVFALNPALRQTPQSLARLHNLYYSALWRGDDVRAITEWLEAHWQEQGPSEPRSAPDAVSLSGRAGRATGIRWYRSLREILGYRPESRRGCYRIPVEDTPPLVPGMRQAGYP